MVIGYLYDCALGTAVVYSPPQHPYVSEIRRRYHRIDKDFWPVSNSIFTEYFINDVPGFLLNGKRWENDKALVLPRNVFEQPSFIRTRGTSRYTIAADRGLRRLIIGFHFLLRQRGRPI